MRGILLDFLPEAVNVYHDGIFIDDGLAPDHLIEHVPGENPVHVVQKQFHHGVFFRGKDDLVPILIKTRGTGVVLEGAGGKDQLRTGQTAPASADQRLGLSDAPCGGGAGTGQDGVASGQPEGAFPAKSR